MRRSLSKRFNVCFLLSYVNSKSVISELICIKVAPVKWNVNKNVSKALFLALLIVFLWHRYRYRSVHVVVA